MSNKNYKTEIPLDNLRKRIWIESPRLIDCPTCGVDITPIAQLLEYAWMDDKETFLEWYCPDCDVMVYQKYEVVLLKIELKLGEIENDADSRNQK